MKASKEQIVAALRDSGVIPDWVIEMFDIDSERAQLRTVSRHEVQQSILLTQTMSERLRAELLSYVSPKETYWTAAGFGVSFATFERFRQQVSLEPYFADKPELVERVTTFLAAPDVKWVVCDQARAAEEMKADAKRQTSDRMAILKKLHDSPVRILPRVTSSAIEAIARLKLDFPNFGAVVDEVLLQLRFVSAAGMPLTLPKLLLIGPPGVGKTEFAFRLAEAVDSPLQVRSIAEMSGSFEITGSSQTWSTAAPGLIAKAVGFAPNGKVPVVIFDELDKAHTRSIHPPANALLGLLEDRTAKRFRDENLCLEIDSSPVRYLFTCNDEMLVDPALRSRLVQVHVEPPTRDQMPAVVRSLDASIRRDTPAIDSLFEPLSDGVTEQMGVTNPRDLRRLLMRVYATAFDGPAPGEGKREVRSEHVSKGLDGIVSDSHARIDFGFQAGRPLLPVDR